jgi:hypothetical protein
MSRAPARQATYFMLLPPHLPADGDRQPGSTTFVPYNELELNESPLTFKWRFSGEKIKKFSIQ